MEELSIKTENVRIFDHRNSEKTECHDLVAINYLQGKREGKALKSNCWKLTF
jgi:hypothetical protein